MADTVELVLNSDSQIHVKASTYVGHSRPSDESLQQCFHVSFDIQVEQTYKSSDGSIKSLKDQIRLYVSPEFPYELLMSDDGTPSSPSWGVVSGIISDLNLSFLVEKVQWKRVMCDEEQGRGYLTQEEQLENHDDLIRHILDYTRLMMPKLSKSGSNVLFIQMCMNRISILSPDEFEALEQTRKMEERVNSLNRMVSELMQAYNRNPNLVNFDYIERHIALCVRETAPQDETRIDKNYERNLRWSLIDRARMELAEHGGVSSTRFVPATKSSVEELDKGRFEGGDSSSHELCPICRDQILVGSQITTMPCSHIYHPNCIEDWLKRSHMCPLCRFKLPTS